MKYVKDNLMIATVELSIFLIFQILYRSAEKSYFRGYEVLNYLNGRKEYKRIECGREKGRELRGTKNLNAEENEKIRNNRVQIFT